jgi:hypothetical protein
MINLKICEQCRGRNYETLAYEYPIIFWCPAGEDLIKEGDQPPMDCPRKMEHAVAAGMENKNA